MTFDESLELAMASALTDLAEAIVGQHADYFTDFHSGHGPNLLDAIGTAAIQPLAKPPTPSPSMKVVTTMVTDYPSRRC